jgi:hypothetical protein
MGFTLVAVWRDNRKEAKAYTDKILDVLRRVKQLHAPDCPVVQITEDETDEAIRLLARLRIENQVLKIIFAVSLVAFGFMVTQYLIK